MNAVLHPPEAPQARFEPMSLASLPAVVQIEQSAYDHPWTAGNFADSLKAGYQGQLLTAGDATFASAAAEAAPPALLGYFVAMKGVDEVHLLNITVAPAFQRQGWARWMLDGLALWSRGQGAQWLWLEVRVSNARAQAVYARYGFRHVGTRRDYYPATASRREDAIVMSLAL